jgi:predicted metalloendopeptidase
MAWRSVRSINARWLVICSTAVVLIACATAQTDAPRTSLVATATLSAKHQPEVGVFGLNVEGMDRSVAPGDDFVRYAVGKWVDTTEIPQDRSSIGSVAVIKEKASLRVRDIIEEAALRRQIVTDILTPTPYRALTVRNLDAWYSTFDVKPGQKLYFAPTERVKIW